MAIFVIIGRYSNVKIIIMSRFTEPPLSLYIHLPWCARKCPYCDFNSHEAKDVIPEEAYITALIEELDQSAITLANRPLISIFFGGGTPSLFSPQAIEAILQAVQKRFRFNQNIEITLEANPGTVDESRFKGFFAAGINRLSLGIQSLQNEKLKILGRIHDSDQALGAIRTAKAAGFTNFNLDLMYGLPDQSIPDALADIEMALAEHPTHFSWYQLTIEPNTFFYHQPPVLPLDDVIWEMQLAGQEKIAQRGFKQYEVSAYSLPNKHCLHNRNYWEFGDYLGIGAGAHSKISHVNEGTIQRFSQVKNPRDYLNTETRSKQNVTLLKETDLIFEFMLNALRLTDGIPYQYFYERTGLSNKEIEPFIHEALKRGFLVDDREHLCPSEQGKKYLNNLVGMFLT